MSRCSATLLATMLLCRIHACCAMEQDTSLVNQLQQLSIEKARRPTLDGMGEEIADNTGRSLIETDPFLHAIAHGNIAQVHHQLDSGANPNYSARDHTHSPLHVAVFFGHEHIAQLLMHYGARIDLPDYLGYTPLHWAALSNNPECVALLTQAGAHADTPRLWRGETPLSRALSESKSRNKFHIIETLLRAGADPQRIFHCAERAWLEHLRLRDFFTQCTEQELHTALQKMNVN